MDDGSRGELEPFSFFRRLNAVGSAGKRDSFARDRNTPVHVTETTAHHFELVTIIQVMGDTMSLAAVKAHFSEVADRVEKQQDRIVVTRNGRPAVVLISPDDLDSLEETLAILSDKRLLAKVRKGLAEADAGKGIPLEQVVESRRGG